MTTDTTARGTTDVSADLVDIVRDFIAVHRAMKRMFAHYRSGELRFEDLREFIGDDERSVLYRLKERCHALFRPRDAASPLSTRGEALFDLAVGSLFHEAMKFRENFYQQEIYGPRVRALGAGSTEDADALFREFEKILATGSERLAEGLQETEILIEQTADQLRVLLAEHANNGFLVRFLIENREQVDEVFGFSLDSLLCEIEGSARAGLELAARSYLDSGFYREAELTFDAAIEAGGEAAELERLSQYARGMAAYLSGNFAECMSRLAEWFDGRATNEENLLDIARVAVSKIDQLAEGDDSERVIGEAAVLVERFGPAVPVENLGTGI
jgi:hypothetical protein